MSTLKPRPRPAFEPVALQELCYRKSGSLVYDICCKIEKQHGSYYSEICRSVVYEFQQHVLEVLVSLFDEVCQRAIQRHFVLKTLCDVRILYAVSIHEYLECFSVPYKHSASYGRVFTAFIEANLSLLINIVHLDLSGIDCSDSVLQVIGSSSTKLKCLTVAMPTKHSIYHVSDSGFMSLSSLHNLRILRDSSKKSFKKIGKATILQLLKVLPNLEEIDFRYIGDVIITYVREQTSVQRRPFSSTVAGNSIKPLSLTCVKIEIHVSKDTSTLINFWRPEMIFALAKACPRLNHLQLLNFEVSPESVRNEYIDNLSNSSINLTILALEGFAFDRRMENLLKTKGGNLKTLMYSPPHVSNGYLDKIGQWCPNVPNLRLKMSLQFPCHYANQEGASPRTFSITGGL